MKKQIEMAQELLRIVREEHDDAGPICELGQQLAHAVLEAAEGAARPKPRLTQTRTYAVLEVESSAYADVRDRLLAADYGHAIQGEGREEVIDMHGIALKCGDLERARYLAPREALRRDGAALLKLLQSSGKRGEKLKALGLSGDEVHRIDMLNEWLRGLVEEMDAQPGRHLTLDTEDRPMVSCSRDEA